MIEVRGLTKRYGPLTVLDGLSFTAQAGRITAFLGPNGSGKTTTLRILLGLVAPAAGEALIKGQPYRDLRAPLRQVGAVLEQGAMHPGQSGRAHLRTHAILAGASRSAPGQLLELAGLAPAADRRIGGYSLGMKQRLGIATALLGDPEVLVLDEPANGLDPEGVSWLRTLLRQQAAAGRCVVISSHVLPEVAELADDVVVIAGGRLVRQAPLAALSDGTPPRVRVRCGDPAGLVPHLQAAGAGVAASADELDVTGLPAQAIGAIAFAAGITVYELTPVSADLQQVFLQLVGHS